MWEIKQTKEFESWYDELTEEKAIAITKKILVIEKIGNLATLKQGSKSLKKGLFELRDKEYGLRAYYCFHGAQIVLLLNGGDKNTKKQQEKDIKKARELLENIKRGYYEQAEVKQF
ncbi:type II toxin-antitoxin system RelE/ParE family toxin [Facilibium subflavum]|uniref:type II toxin-antitoxin system RelE/ParE family toxin n=1 Tax=Facilibium subflavum TaxID=2219058 RepID=UPI000E64EF0F|nr:type II toxin-antitoxin system RelE/ParE family toxin [Facilibium subflavum]